MLTVDPKGMTATAWAAEVGRQISGYGQPIPKLIDEKEWKRWAQQVILLPGISAVTPPSPGLFSHWRDWAVRFNLSIQSLPELPP